MKLFKTMFAAVALSVLSVSVCAVPTDHAVENESNAAATKSQKKQRSNQVTLSLVESRAQQPVSSERGANNQPVTLITPVLLVSSPQ